MADVKREVRALGQKITGLKAGDNVTLVLKKPKPKVDATSAKRAAKISDEAIGSAKNVVRLLSAARRQAPSNGEAAKKQWQEAKSIFESMQGAVPRAKDWVKFAEDDASSAPGEVKDGYDAAKDGADTAVGQLDKVVEGLDEAVRAVGALIEEACNRG
jgi:hypothetical protein